MWFELDVWCVWSASAVVFCYVLIIQTKAVHVWWFVAFLLVRNVFWLQDGVLWRAMHGNGCILMRKKNFGMY